MAAAVFSPRGSRSARPFGWPERRPDAASQAFGAPPTRQAGKLAQQGLPAAPYRPQCAAITSEASTVPEGLEPTNQDGEVDEFALRSTEELHTDVAQDRFTLEASLVMAAHWGR